MIFLSIRGTIFEEIRIVSLQTAATTDTKEDHNDYKGHDYRRGY